MIAVNRQERVIKPHRQDVYIEGSLSYAVKCTQCNSQSASFIVPKARWDDRLKKSIHNKKISVRVNGKYLFTGFVDASSANVGPKKDSIAFEAKSVLTKLDFIYVGQDTGQSTVYYYIMDDAHYGIEAVVQDMFARMPIYGGVITLGDTSVLNDERYVFDDSFIFRMASYRNALEQVLSYCGDIAYAPRFTANGCEIDFYRVTENSNGTTFADLADYGDDIIYSDVAELSEGMTSTDKIDQVIVYGSPKKFVISCYSHLGDPETRLIPGWDPGLEELVLSFPDAAKKGTPGYRPGAEYVFRRYYLPPSLRPMRGLHDILLLKDLPVQKLVPGSPEPQNYQLQAFAWMTTMIPYPDPASHIAATGQVNADPTQLNCQFVLDQGYVMFNDPTLRLLQVEMLIDTTTGEKVPRRTYELAPVGITIGVENTDHVMMATAGTAAGNPNTLSVLNERLTAAYYTNIGYPIRGVTFPISTIYREDTANLVDIYHIDQPIVLRDDSATLSKMANEILKEKRWTERHVEYTYNFITVAPRPGNKLVVTGTNEFSGDELAITDVTHDLQSYTTTVTATNIKPPLKSTINGRGMR